jgi:hypothetical protein
MFLEHFWGRMEIVGDCWEWVGARHEHGYGQFRSRGRTFRAHRTARELTTREPVPPEMDVLHTCDNPPCCNPSHLYVGTPVDNARDMIARGRDTRGAKNARAKLTDAKVIEIRAAVRLINQRAIARQFGISQANVSRIINRKGWAHVA